MSRPHTFDTAFPSDATRCANCGAPARRHELANPPKPGMWVQRFDLAAAIAERIAALTRADALELLRNIEGIETRARFDIRDDIAARVRYYVRRALLTPKEGT